MKAILILSSTIFLMLSSADLSAQDSLQIGFSLGDFFVDRWYKDRDYFVEQANQQGVAVQLAYGYGIPENQTKETIKLIDNGVKVIVIVPTDTKECKDIVTKAHEAGVKVISYDRLALDVDIDYYISFDNEKVGELQAKYALENAPKGNYVLLGGPVKDNNALLFLKGQESVLKSSIESGDINIVLKKHLKEWNSMEAFMEIQTISEQLSGINAVIASNDLIASGVLMAYEMEGVESNIILTGQDASLDGCKNILAGKQSMTVYKPLFKLATEAVKLAIEIAENEEISSPTKFVNNGTKDVPSILLTPIVVTKDNMNETVIADGFVTKEELEQ